MIAHVFVTRRLPGSALDRLAAEHEVAIWPAAMPPEPLALAEAVRDVDALLCLLTDRVDTALLDGASRLTAIANYAVGCDNIDLRTARKRGLQVGVTPDVLTDATADLAFALLLSAARRLHEAADDVRAGRWCTWEPAGWLGADVHEATLGIVGYGRIGRAVARRAAGFEMRVLTTADTPLDSLLAEADFVTIHCPLSPATHHLIGAAALARMKPSAILVNTARGPIVDQAALARALHAGTIAAAALDVTDPEPLAPDDSLLEAPNLLVVPHIGSATHTARARMADLAVDNLLEALAGRPMPHPAP